MTNDCKATHTITALRKKTQSFYQRWNIHFDEKEEFERFRNRIVIALDRSIGYAVVTNHALSDTLLLVIGASCEPRSSHAGVDDIAYFDEEEEMNRRSYFKDNPLCQFFSATQSEVELVRGLQCIAWVLDDEEEHDHVRNRFIQSVANALDSSPYANVRLLDSKGKTLFVPRGVKLLDDALINDPLDWLRVFPAACKSFEQALVIYQEHDGAKYRNLVDNLRWAIEHLLQKVLKNKKNLENQKALLLPWLQQRGVNQKIISMYEDLLFQKFRLLQNDDIKHGDGDLTVEEIEFLIYLTGLFMRFLIQVIHTEAEIEEKTLPDKV